GVEAGVAGVGGSDDVSTRGEGACLVFGVGSGVETEDATVDRSAGVGEGDIAGRASLPGGPGDLGAEEEVAAVRIGRTAGESRGAAVRGVVEHCPKSGSAGLWSDGQSDGVGVAGSVDAVARVVGLNRVGAAGEVAERAVVGAVLQGAVLHR